MHLLGFSIILCKHYLGHYVSIGGETLLSSLHRYFFGGKHGLGTHVTTNHFNYVITTTFYLLILFLLSLLFIYFLFLCYNFIHFILFHYILLNCYSTTGSYFSLPLPL
ncbi:hypothetical protein PPACK8108_LOCUS16923, partial [Phakopsora pachyrhizi]